MLVEGLGVDGMVRGCWLRDYEETGWRGVVGRGIRGRRDGEGLLVEGLGGDGMVRGCW